MKVFTKIFITTAIAGVMFSACEKNLTEPKLRTLNENSDVALTKDTDENVEKSSDIWNNPHGASVLIGNIYSYDEVNKIGLIQKPGEFEPYEFINNKNLVIIVGDDYRYQESYKNIPGEGKQFTRVILSKVN